MIRALVVDDEPLARERILALLRDAPGFEAAGACSDGLEALEACARLRPDVLLLDIQMPGLDGLEVAEALEPPLPLVVFITAYDRYALAAFEKNALDYLQKPIDPERFRRALERVRTMMAGQARLEHERRVRALLRDRAGTPNGLVVQERGRYLVVPLGEVRALEATGNYVCIHARDGSHFLRATLTAVEARLDPGRFRRTHRSWIVNLDHVASARPGSKGAWALETRGGPEVPVSAAHRDAVAAFLDSSRPAPLSSRKV